MRVCALEMSVRGSDVCSSGCPHYHSPSLCRVSVQTLLPGAAAAAATGAAPSATDRPAASETVSRPQQTVRTSHRDQKLDSFVRAVPAGAARPADATAAATTAPAPAPAATPAPGKTSTANWLVRSCIDPASLKRPRWAPGNHRKPSRWCWQ